ncbi:MAG: hypothetical protein K2P81_00265 [Bacteriovoracaceae bacterium]|nr:hypothetical protein [Bacteriovoracaceae bacterium]
MWNKMVTSLSNIRLRRQAPSSCGAFVVKFPKRIHKHVSVEDLTAEKLRSILENYACALHFTGSEEKLRSLLEGLAPSESLNLDHWHIVDGGDDSKIVQVRLTGEREIRRLVRLTSQSL